MRERKARNTGSPAAATGPLTVADYAAEGLRLRTEMARAVEAEKWVFPRHGTRGFAPLISHYNTLLKAQSAWRARWRQRNGCQRVSTQLRPVCPP